MLIRLVELGVEKLVPGTVRDDNRLSCGAPEGKTRSAGSSSCHKSAAPRQEHLPDTTVSSRVGVNARDSVNGPVARSKG